MNDDESLIEVIALRDITSGEEISVNLPMNNAGMLLTFGYTLNNNENDVVPITTQLSDSDIMYESKARMLKSIGHTTTSVHPITKKEGIFPPSALACMRIQALNWE